MNKVKVITPKEASKLMHGVVTKLDHARAKLQKDKAARQNMYRNWTKFLTDAIQRWQQHSENFAKEDAELWKAMETATSNFLTARTHLEETLSTCGIRQCRRGRGPIHQRRRFDGR